MTKTVKEIVDDYKHRTQSPIYEFLTFETNHGKDTEQFYNVRNVYRDKVPLSDLNLDNEYHEYTFEYYVKTSVFDRRPSYWEQLTFNGKLERFSQIIKE